MYSRSTKRKVHVQRSTETHLYLRNNMQEYYIEHISINDRFMYDTFVKYYNLATNSTKNINLNSCIHHALTKDNPFREILALASV